METLKDSFSKVDHIKTVLIGSSGAGNAFAAALALRRSWGNSIKIIAIDTNPKCLVTASIISDKFYQVADVLDQEFRRNVKKILIEEAVDTYAPFLNDEIFVAALLYEEELFNKNLTLQVKNSKVANMCDDKYETFLWLSELNVLTPLCFNKNSHLHNEDKLILKPRRGFGSNVTRLSQAKDFISQYNFDKYILQQECEKPEITIDVCFDKTRNYFKYVCRERLEVKSGVCTKARLFYDNKLEKIAFKIANHLNLSSYCFQVMKLKGEWAVTDVNARLGAGTAMSYAAGMDFFSGMFAILWGEDASSYFRPMQIETIVTRQYSEFLMNF